VYGADHQGGNQQQLDGMWEHAVPLKEAVEGYPHWIDPDWLDAVSRPQDPLQQFAVKLHHNYREHTSACLGDLLRRGT